jgi:hypothetical protein
MYKKYFLMLSLLFCGSISQGINLVERANEEVAVGVVEIGRHNENCWNQAVRWFDRRFGVVPAVNCVIAAQVILLGIVGRGLYREYIN